MIPRIAFEARLGAEPELRFGQSGTAICRLRLVTSDRRRNQQTGDWEDGDTLWIDGTCFKDYAEHAAESLTKGDLVLVQGRLRTEEWESNGERRSKIALTIDDIGPSLRFRTLKHGTGVEEERNGRRQPVDQSTNRDPWAGQSSEEAPF